MNNNSGQIFEIFPEYIVCMRNKNWYRLQAILERTLFLQISSSVILAMRINNSSLAALMEDQRS